MFNSGAGCRPRNKSFSSKNISTNIITNFLHVKCLSDTARTKFRSSSCESSEIILCTEALHQLPSILVFVPALKRRTKAYSYEQCSTLPFSQVLGIERIKAEVELSLYSFPYSKFSAPSVSMASWFCAPAFVHSYLLSRIISAVFWLTACSYLNMFLVLRYCMSPEFTEPYSLLPL